MIPAELDAIVRIIPLLTSRLLVTKNDSRRRLLRTNWMQLYYFRLLMIRLLVTKNDSRRLLRMKS